jgi:hypothetical protein
LVSIIHKKRQVDDERFITKVIACNFRTNDEGEEVFLSIGKDFSIQKKVFRELQEDSNIGRMSTDCIIEMFNHRNILVAKSPQSII